MKIGEDSLRRQWFFNGFGDTEIDDFGRRFSVQASHEDIGGLQVTVDDSFLVRVLNRVAKLNEQSQPFFEGGLIRCAIFRDLDSPNQLHHEVRTARWRCPAVKHPRNAGMIHERQRLTFRFKSGHHALGVHAQLDHLERNMAPNRFALLSPIDNPESALADLFQKFVSPDPMSC